MATEAARATIDAVMAELVSLQGPIDYDVGRLETLSQHDLPHVMWDYAAITHEAPDFVGGPDGQIFVEWQAMTVAIWQDTQDNCRVTKNNLLLAAVNAVDGPQFRPGQFNWATEQNFAFLNRGALLVGTVAFKLGVPNNPSPLVTVLSEDFSASANGEIQKPLGG